MDEQSWVEKRLSAALKAANSDAHVFPEVLLDEIRTLINKTFQEPKKPAELEKIASIIVKANRGDK